MVVHLTATHDSSSKDISVVLSETGLQNELSMFCHFVCFAIATPFAFNNLLSTVCNLDSTEAALRCLLMTFLFAHYNNALRALEGSY